jgi:hypothetical protein
MASVEELVAEIGLSENELRRVLKRDDRYIDQLVVRGIPQDEAEYHSFRGDLRNILSLMRTHNFSAKTAARILGQMPEEPFEFHSTMEEEEDGQDEDEPDQDEDEEEEQQERQTDEEGEQEEDDDDTAYPDSSCSNSLRDTCSLTSSEDEETEAKMIRLDPDYAPSTTSDGTETLAATAPSSQVPSEEEEDSDDETEVSSYVQSSTTSADEADPGNSEEVEEM